MALLRSGTRIYGNAKIDTVLDIDGQDSATSNSTGALKVDFTKTGKRTFAGMIDDGLNSVMRYYINNFTDGVR